MRIYLDFDGVLHRYTDEYYLEMHKMESCRKSNVDYYEVYGQNNYKVFNNQRVFWLPHFFENAQLLSSILEEYSRVHPVEIYVHSNWRGYGLQVISEIMSTIKLDKFFKGILPLDFQNQYRLINILHHLQQSPSNKWIAIDDYEDLFMPLSENHFVKCESHIGLQQDTHAMHKLIALLQRS